MVASPGGWISASRQTDGDGVYATKNKQVDELTEHGFDYIMFITKPQSESLCDQSVTEMTLFGQPPTELIADKGTSGFLD